MCAKMRGKVECLYTVGKNINVWKEKVRTRIFGSKGREFNVSTDKGQKSNVDKKGDRIPVFGRTMP